MKYSVCFKPINDNLLSSTFSCFFFRSSVVCVLFRDVIMSVKMLPQALAYNNNNLSKERREKRRKKKNDPKTIKANP